MFFHKVQWAGNDRGVVRVLVTSTWVRTPITMCRSTNDHLTDKGRKQRDGTFKTMQPVVTSSKPGGSVCPPGHPHTY